MRAKKKSILAFFFLTTGMLGLVSGQEDTLAPRTEKKEWKVGITSFVEKSFATSLASPAAFLPKALLDEMRRLEEHKLSSQERTWLAQEMLENKENASLKTLTTLHDKRDALFFDMGRQARQLDEAEEKILKEEEQLAYWRNLGTAQIIVPDSLPLVFVKESGGGDILNLEENPPKIYRKKKLLDVLITGEILHVGDYYGLRIMAYREIASDVLWEGAVNENDWDRVIEETGKALRRLLLGRSWAGLTINVEPSSAQILVEGQSVGIGRWSDMSLDPGKFSIEILQRGYAPQSMDYWAEAGEHKTFSVDLEILELPQVLVRSKPTGADVWRGSLWLGKTPLSFDLPDRVTPLTFQLNEYRKRIIPLLPESEHLVVSLEKIVEDPLVVWKREKKRLYNSIAWFSFSVAPTVILQGISRNYFNQELLSSSAAAANNAHNSYVISSAFMWGSVGINAALLTTVLFRLAKYLKAAEEIS